MWILRSAYLERIDTGERILPYGENPRGVLMLHEGGRMAAIITPSDQSGDKAPPRRKLLAYSGRYRIEPPNRFVTDVDIAWIPSWVGTPRGRTFSLRDGMLDIVSDPAPVEFLDWRDGKGNSHLGARRGLTVRSPARLPAVSPSARSAPPAS